MYYAVLTAQLMQYNAHHEWTLMHQHTNPRVTPNSIVKYFDAEEVDVRMLKYAPHSQHLVTFPTQDQGLIRIWDIRHSTRKPVVTMMGEVDNKSNNLFYANDDHTMLQIAPDKEITQRVQTHTLRDQLAPPVPYALIKPGGIRTILYTHKNGTTRNITIRRKGTGDDLAPRSSQQSLPVTIMNNTAPRHQYPTPRPISCCRRLAGAVNSCCSTIRKWCKTKNS